MSIMRVLSALEAAWVVFIFAAVFFAWPAFVFRWNSNPDMLLRITGNFVRTLLCVSIASFGLSHLDALNTISILLLFAGVATLSWLLTTAKSLDWKSIQRSAIGAVRQMENWSYTLHLLPRERPRIFVSAYQSARPWPRLLRGRVLPTLSLLTVLVMIGILSWQHAVRELRLDEPAEYGALLQSRELTLGVRSGTRPLLFPSMIATTALFSGRDAMEVARYLSPLTSLFVALAVGLFVYTFSQSSIATAVAIYCVGAAAFPAVTNGLVPTDSIRERVLDILRTSPAEIRPGSEQGLGIVFVLLGLVFLAHWTEHTNSWQPLADVACCLILATLVSNIFLLLLVGAAGALLVRRWCGLIALVLALYGAAIYAEMARQSNSGEVRALLPVAAAIGAGSLLAFVESRFPARESACEMALLGGCVIAALVWFRPHLPPKQCLEYEAAARVTERIAHEFPHETWAVAAPVEQLSETLGLGVHEDLSQFVEKYRTAVETQQFLFPAGLQDLFVYVEKSPFQLFSTEPAFINYSLLTDPTYRSYRSPAARASVESAALSLCETYRRHHSNVDIFFEDAQLRVYHFRQQASSGIRHFGD